MDYHEAVKVIMAKLEGKPITDEEIKQAIREHPSIATRLRQGLYPSPPEWAMDGLRKMAELRKKANNDKMF